MVHEDVMRVQSRKSEPGFRHGIGMTGYAAFALVLSTPMTVTAQQSAGPGALEEIIVTAQRREENLQQTGVAVTAVSAETLDAVNAQSLYDIARVAPNIQFGGAFGGSSLYVRGIGQQQPGLLSDPGAAIYVDGVYRPRVAGNSTNFGDVKQLEVLRGPQGTLFGKNSLGGAMTIVSVAPNNDLGATVEAQGGSRNRIKGGASVNVPIVQDTLAARFAIERNKQDGHMKDLQNGRKLDDTNYYTARGSLLWTPSKDLNITLRGDYTDQDQNGPGSKSITNPDPTLLTAGKYETRGDYLNYSKASDTGVSATVDWNVGAGTFKSITANRHWTQQFATDSDGTPDLTTKQHVSSGASENFTSQELQYNAKVFDDRLNFTLGAFYMDEHVLEAVFPRIQAFPGFPLQINLDNYRDQTTKSYALFGQGMFNFTDSLSLTLGLRWTRDDKDVSFLEYNYTPAPTNPTFPLGGIDINKTLNASYSAVTPMGRLQYQFTPDLMTYVTASKGFKGGGFNGAPTSPAGFSPFNPEYLWNYEAGLKSEWFDKRVRANLAAYRMNYTDIQLTSDSSGVIVVSNAGKARIKGLEAEFNVLVTRSLLLNASYGRNDFAFTSLAAGAQDASLSTILPNSPETTATGGAEYTIDFANASKLVLRTDYAWKSKTYFDAANTEATAQEPYGLWSARVSYLSEGNRWSVFAYGINLADKYYHTGGQANFGQTYILPGPPREVGVGFKANFGK